MFFIAMAALILRGVNLLGQQLVLSTFKFPEIDAQWKQEDREQASELLLQTESWSPRVITSYLGKRLTDLLEMIRSTGTAATLGDEMKYASERDADRQYEGASLVRIIICVSNARFSGYRYGDYAGIGRSCRAADRSDLNGAMQGLLAVFMWRLTRLPSHSLCHRPDVLSVYVDQLESQILSDVDQQVEDALRSRFSGNTADVDSWSVVVEEMVKRKASQWSDAITVIQKQWQQWTAQQENPWGMQCACYDLRNGSKSTCNRNSGKNGRNYLRTTLSY